MSQDEPANVHPGEDAAATSDAPPEDSTASSPPTKVVTSDAHAKTIGPPQKWQAETKAGIVYEVTLEQLNEAFQAGRVDLTLRVRAPGSDSWATLGEHLAATEDPSPAPPVAPPLAVPEALVFDLTPIAKPPRPVLGPALIVFGASTWAYVVMGTFTTTWSSGGGVPLAPGTASTLVALVTIGAWVLAIWRSRSVPTPGTRTFVVRSVRVALLALAFWIVSWLAAVVAGNTSSANLDAFIAAVLLSVAAVAVGAGYRFLVPVGVPRGSPTRARRFAVVAAWVGVAAITLGACAELVAESS